MKILFTICGRAGSKGFKNKNLKKMRGVPLVHYTLAAIKGYVDKHPKDEVTVALNTDSGELIDLARKQAEVSVCVIERKESLAKDATPKVDVIKDTFLSCGGVEFDAVIDLDLTSPMRSVCDIDTVIKEYVAGDYDLVCSVVEARRSPYFNMVEKKSDGYYRKICKSNFTARQQAPRAYELNASIYAYNPAFLIGDIEKTILDCNCGICVMSDYLVLDIDSEKDFRMMSFLHDYYCRCDEGIYEVYKIAKSMNDL